MNLRARLAIAATAFDRFWRTSASHSRSGSGLGRPIAQAVVTAHHGKLRMQTSVEQGTTVDIGLPQAAD